jgi:hypothetical protein
MKTSSNEFQFAAGLLLTILCVHAPTLRAQGVLTPPGAVTPNLKSLTQVEPRTAITNANTGFIIAQSGSYYLTTNLIVSSGYPIVINAGNVKLDLNGFTLGSTASPAGSAAIFISSSLTNLAILNGFISSPVTNNGALVYGGAGFSQGIQAGGPEYNVRVEGVQISGCTSHGINLGVGTVTLVKNCRVTDVGGIGIAADLVLNCTVNAAGYGGTYGIQAGTVGDTRCVSYSGTGISAAQNAFNCKVISTAGIGLATTVAANCYGSSSNSIAIDAEVVNNCSGTSSLSSGIFTWVGRNSIGGTTSTGSYGFYTSYLATGCNGNGGGAANGIYSGHSLISCNGNGSSAVNKYNMP